MRKKGRELAALLKGRAGALRKIVRERVRPWETELASELLAVADELDFQGDRIERSTRNAAGAPRRRVALGPRLPRIYGAEKRPEAPESPFQPAEIEEDAQPVEAGGATVPPT